MGIYLERLKALQMANDLVIERDLYLDSRQARHLLEMMSGLCLETVMGL